MLLATLACYVDSELDMHHRDITNIFGLPILTHRNMCQNAPTKHAFFMTAGTATLHCSQCDNQSPRVAYQVGYVHILTRLCGAAMWRVRCNHHQVWTKSKVAICAHDECIVSMTFITTIGPLRAHPNEQVPFNDHGSQNCHHGAPRTTERSDRGDQDIHIADVWNLQGLRSPEHGMPPLSEVPIAPQLPLCDFCHE